MKMKYQIIQKAGFSLLEMLLVLAIIAAILGMIAKYSQQHSTEMLIEKTTGDIQAYLSEAMSHYASTNKWPVAAGSSKDLGSINPWGNSYNAAVSSPKPQVYYVYTAVTAGSATYGIAQTISGRLPLAYTSTAAGTPPSGAACTTASTTCYVVASVNIPAQNLNNAMAVNYTGIYKHGACVPAPACPVDSAGNQMRPAIVVVPTSVTGVNDDPGVPNPTSLNAYPISSFTAYAYGDVVPNGSNNPQPTNMPLDCATASVATACPATQGGAAMGGKFWRVCLQIITTKGDVGVTNPDFGKYVNVMAMTRCLPATEEIGSDFTVYTP